MMRYGLWVDEPNGWTGWAGFAAGGKFVPLTFDETEAQERARLYEANCPGASVSPRGDPPSEIAWAEAALFATDGAKQAGLIDG